MTWRALVIWPHLGLERLARGGERRCQVLNSHPDPLLARRPRGRRPRTLELRHNAAVIIIIVPAAAAAAVAIEVSTTAAAVAAFDALGAVAARAGTGARAGRGEREVLHSSARGGEVGVSGVHRAVGPRGKCSPRLINQLTREMRVQNMVDGAANEERGER